jgi:hypothetical protein
MTLTALSWSVVIAAAILIVMILLRGVPMTAPGIVTTT